MIMEKINIAELLKDCPPGMELDCALYECAELDCVTNDKKYPIEIIIKDDITGDIGISLTKEGYYNPLHNPKCVIFPKGKTTWEGFHRPFVDGDIVAIDSAGGSQVFIFEEYIRKDYAHCYLMLDDDGTVDFGCGDYYVERFATEEEKEKLFKAIKDNGYRWNAETKTLEKLPKFKVGDKVRHKNNHGVAFTITNIEEDSYVCGAKAAFWFDDQDDYELVPNKFDITTLKPFDKVLVRDNDNSMWTATLFSHLRGMTFDTVGGWYNQCIPYEGNEHLLGKTDDCDEFYKNW